MIEAIARGPVQFHEHRRVDKRDGWDTIHGRVTETRTAEVEIHLEFPQGHVNLEGYALSSPGGATRDAPIGSFDFYLDLGRDAEIVAGEWQAELRGEWWDWVQQSHRYQVERPERSIIDCLTLFGRWDEVSNRPIELAKESLLGPGGVGKAALVTTPMGELTESEYTDLRYRLNEVDDRINAKESYRPENTA